MKCLILEKNSKVSVKDLCLNGFKKVKSRQIILFIMGLEIMPNKYQILKEMMVHPF